jgi:Ca2+-binding RTX toxin-like protein
MRDPLTHVESRCNRLSERYGIMHFETLEVRRLCSVTVSQGYPGFYEVYGDEGDNEISISVSMDDQSFSLDGQTYNGLQQLAVYGLGGNDMIMVSAGHAAYISATIDGGDGDDQLALNFDGSVSGGAGSDRIYLSDAFRGEAYGGSSDDYVWINGDNVDAYIDGGDGDDYIDASSNNYRVFIHGGEGSDTIIGSDYDDQIFGDGGSNVIYGMGGNDQIFVRNGSYDCTDGGGGTDVCYADGYHDADHVADSVSGFEYVFYG